MHKLIAMSFLLFVLVHAVPAQNNLGNPFIETAIDLKDWKPALVKDSLMPTATEVETFRLKIKKLFRPDQVQIDSAEPRLKLLKQGYGRLEYNRSVLGTPLKIGRKQYNKGLGTYARSEIRVTMPEPIKRFSSQVGVDNYNNKGITTGSVQFVLKDSVHELYRSPTLRGGDEAYGIDISLQQPTDEFYLIVDATTDGEPFDKSNWCSPIAVGISGRVYDLSEMNIWHQPKASLPFSFTVDGKSSREFLKNWEFNEEIIDKLNIRYSWKDPESGLKVIAEVRLFDDFTAADWILHLHNEGTRISGLIEDVRTFDFTLQTTDDTTIPGMICTIKGDNNTEESFLPQYHKLATGESKRFEPVNGRSSDGAFPFWNIQPRETARDAAGQGLFVAIGWSGQWFADFSKSKDDSFHFAAGMANIATKLQPGEIIRQPRTLIYAWKHSREASHVVFRRLLMHEYSPTVNGQRPIQIPFAGQNFSRYEYWGKDPKWLTQEGQEIWGHKLKEAGLTTHWMDAGWYSGAFPLGVGNWTTDTVRYPLGLEHLRKDIQKRDMNFLLWFEPERVAKNTIITEQYPQYVVGGSEGGLFKLHDPTARRYMTDLLSDRIQRYGVDILRIDFNISPLRFWVKEDQNDRIGMTEVRYIEGLYSMWNELRATHPGLWIDNCASGGRRLDLETTSISVPLWRSDISCRPERGEWQQTQTLGIAQYLPLFSSGQWEYDPYQFRSAANMGVIASFNYLDDSYNLTEARQAVQEAKVYQKFWYGDFYPLTEARLGNDNLHAWQLHRPDLDAGLVYVFRQIQSPIPSIELDLRAIDHRKTYEVTIKYDYNRKETKTLDGAELQAMLLERLERESATIVEYRAI